MERDFEKNPYSPDEARVAERLSEAGIGGGDDPIGYVLASFSYLTGQVKGLESRIESLELKTRR